LLRRLYQSITITPEVHAEFLPPESVGLAHLKSLPAAWIRVKPVDRVVDLGIMPRESA
jgi:hypothetical protein